MSSFKLRNRPKKPSRPEHFSYDIGNCVALSHFLEEVKGFCDNHQEIDEADICIEAEDNGYDGDSIYLTAPPESPASYEKKMEEYKEHLWEYKEWQKKNKKKIEQAKAEKAALVKKRKLERTQERLNKELAEVEAKLEKS